MIFKFIRHCRQELGSCKICWTTSVGTDFDVSGKLKNSWVQLVSVKPYYNSNANIFGNQSIYYPVPFQVKVR